MRRSSWLLALWVAVLVACGVTSEPTSSQAITEQEATSSAMPAADEVDPAGGTGTEAAAPREACSPVGTHRTCCPFPNGCSCRGLQTCLSTGQWGTCLGAGRAGQPCP